MAKQQFDAELIEGHKSVVVVIVPFDPEDAWSRKPVRLDPRRDGWLVKGTMNDVPFVGYVGNRWGRFFIIVDGALREEAGVAVGDTVTMVVEPTMSAKAFAKACEQSKMTTAPAKGRADAIDMPKAPKR